MPVTGTPISPSASSSGGGRLYVKDYLSRLLLEAPEARVGDFLHRLNDAVRSLWREYRWPYYLSEATISATHSFSNLTVTNGASTATVVDAAAGGLFHRLHAGKFFTIGGTAYTVSSVTDANTLVLATTSATTGSGVSGTLPRVAFETPSDFGRQYGRPYRAARILPPGADREYYGDYLEHPRDYAVSGPVSGVWTFEFGVLLGEDYTLPYLRTPVAATGPASAVDVDVDVEAVLYQDLLRHYLRGMRARDEIELAQLQQRVRAADTEYARTLAKARGVSESAIDRRRQNAPVVI